MTIELALLTALAGYLLGAVPFGLVITKMAGLGDIRDIGSGNIGATNVLRTGRKDLALVTLLLDSGKGAISALLALYILGSDYAPVAAAAAFLGHCYPIYLKFNGGKGVATFFGSVLAIFPILGGITIATWLLTAVIFRMSSLSALVAAAATPVVAHYLGAIEIVPYLMFMAIIIFLRHKENIERIIKGEEPKIGKK